MTEPVLYSSVLKSSPRLTARANELIVKSKLSSSAIAVIDCCGQVTSVPSGMVSTTEKKR